MSFLRGLGGQLFLSHFLASLLALTVLVLAALFLAPLSFYHLLHGMMMQGMMEAFLRSAFAQALYASLWIALSAAAGLATVISLLLAGRLAGLLSRFGAVSAAIASGDFGRPLAEEGPVEIAELARSFNRMAQRLDDARRSRRELTANVLHELGTPLSVLQGYLEGMQDGVVSPDAPALKTLQREVERLGRLVRDLRLVEQAEEGRLYLSFQEVALPAFLAETGRKFLPRYAAMGITLRVECPGDWSARADPDRLGQILDNLLENALDHTPPGGRVTLAAAAGDGYVSLSVSDTGTGIKPEHLPRIFDRFYRVGADRSRRRGGSGLGLAIVKSLVEAQGGRIRASSEPGYGTVFSFTLPRFRT